jgi:phosphatidylglycerophosphate synthase
VPDGRTFRQFWCFSAARYNRSIVTASYAAKAAIVVGAMALVIAPRVRRHHPFARLGPANQVTSVRALLVALLAAMIGEPQTPALAAAAVFLATAVTLLDGVDGWLARRTAMTSPFGARFDTEIDALLIQVLAILAWAYGKAGAWVLLSGLLRYMFVGAGRIWPWMRRPLAPTRRARAVCVVQIAGLVLAVAPFVRSPFSDAIAGASLLLLSYSFLVDVLRLWRYA